MGRAGVSSIGAECDEQNFELCKRLIKTVKKSPQIWCLSISEGWVLPLEGAAQMLVTV